jgi:hypothetical protein
MAVFYDVSFVALVSLAAMKTCVSKTMKIHVVPRISVKITLFKILQAQAMTMKSRKAVTFGTVISLIEVLFTKRWFLNTRDNNIFSN